MSTRTAIRPYAVIDGESMGASITGAPTVLQSISNFSYDITWTGTSPVGTVSLQVSNTYAIGPDGTESVAGTWTSVPVEINSTSVATTVAVSGSTGDIFMDIQKHTAYAVRIIYTRVSGTGTMTAIFKGGVS